MYWADEQEDISFSPYKDGFLTEYKGGLDRPFFCAATRISDAVQRAVRMFPLGLSLSLIRTVPPIANPNFGPVRCRFLQITACLMHAVQLAWTFLTQGLPLLHHNLYP